MIMGTLNVPFYALLLSVQCLPSSPGIPIWLPLNSENHPWPNLSSMIIIGIDAHAGMRYTLILPAWVALDR